MNINIPQMIVTLVNLLILFWIVKHFAFDRVNKILKDRKNLIEDTINKADEDLEKARVLKLQNQREIKSAREEGKTIVSQYKSKADSIYKEIVEDARKEASIIIEKSKVEIDRERNKAEDDIKNQVVDLAMTISEKVLGESIDMNKHKELIDEYISKVGM
ncbi:ATP synthase F0 subunit B [Clostridium baratii]|nr:ATP synthase F0 subunit B [Clostridium baratii]KJU73231.1 ATP F0F1 synthase subunit B [Clostridium baratii]OPF56389.1 ATP synthase F0 subunit B [Clostridium baratii]OPF58469.1 ATP synthase F0 subunit B [Clostridium baratii]OPF60686.1 ATP synthase F0 subunit B [Clostridium baratii]